VSRISGFLPPQFTPVSNFYAIVLVKTFGQVNLRPVVLRMLRLVLLPLFSSAPGHEVLIKPQLDPEEAPVLTCFCLATVLVLPTPAQHGRFQHPVQPEHHRVVVVLNLSGEALAISAHLLKGRDQCAPMTFPIAH
jgi:hypothetical protein